MALLFWLVIASLTTPLCGSNILGGIAGTLNGSSSALACDDIDNALPGVVAYPIRDLTRFQAELHHYWSQADADLIPACITFPTNAADVSTIVGVLNKHTDVNFAIKSGGHNTNQGWSSVDGGVLIAFSSNAATNLSTDGLTADIGPGARWGEVMDALSPAGKVVVGGRIGDVGVGGYLLGGGLSFLSAEYGFACDNVVNYEVVLADGSIVNANSTSHSDLFFALKGGGNQFGIVTKFTMKTISMGQIWGGVRTYAGVSAAALINATQNFIQDYSDPKAAIIATAERDAIVDIFVVFYFYNGDSPPDFVFSEFNAIPYLTDSTKVQTFASLINSNNEFNLQGLRYLIRATTLPSLPDPDGKDLLNYHYNTWSTYAAAQSTANPDFLFSMAFQPLPKAIASASAAAGGDALALDPANGDRVWMEYDVSWLTAAGDDAAHAAAMEITAQIDAYAQSTYGGVRNTNYQEGDLAYEEYNPVFMNDAMYDQTPLQTYPQEAYRKLVDAKKVYDPEGFFSTRTGGFKFT